MKAKSGESYIHPSAIIEKDVKIGKDVYVWHFAHIRTGAVLQDMVSLARDVYVDRDVQIGKGTRVQNGVSLYSGLKISSFCFIGPHVIFTNDLVPRSTNKSWKIVPTILEEGCSIGAGSIIICGVKIGAYALVGAGSVVTNSIPAFHLATGNPARLKKMICVCGNRLFPLGTPISKMLAPCCKENARPDALSSAKKLIKSLSSEKR